MTEIPRGLCQCGCGRATSIAKKTKNERGQTKGLPVFFISGHNGINHPPNSENNVTHGNSRRQQMTPTYRVWGNMKSRCFNKKNPMYYLYGGRGITVCERWLTFSHFLEDMGEAPKGLSIDRYPNKDGNYEPGNCRWATHAQQQRNTKQTRTITFNGETMCIADWNKTRGFSLGTLGVRLRNGWSIADALTIPTMERSQFRRGHKSAMRIQERGK